MIFSVMNLRRFRELDKIHKTLFFHAKESSIYDFAESKKFKYSIQIISPK